MLLNRIKIYFLIILFAFMNAGITLSWIDGSLIPVIPEEIREQSGSEEESIYSLDLFLTASKDSDELGYKLNWNPSQIIISNNNFNSGSFVLDHYSPPENVNA